MRDGAALDEFIQFLEEFRRACGGPGIRELARVSRQVVETSGKRYRYLQVLSPTALSDVLNRRRKKPPSWSWVASYVLSCQRYAAESGLIPHDPGGPSLSELRFFRQYGRHGVDLLAAAEDRQDPEACFRLGLLLCMDDRPTESLAWLMQAESHGHPGASRLIEHPSPRAVDHGHARAAFELGALSMERQDPPRAVFWFSRAAECGHPLAQWLDPLAHHLHAGLRRHNRLASETGRLRQRAAVHSGRVHRDLNGVAGHAALHLFRLLEAAALKKAFNAGDADLGLIVSDELYPRCQPARWVDQSRRLPAPPGLLQGDPRLGLALAPAGRPLSDGRHRALVPPRPPSASVAASGVAFRRRTACPRAVGRPPAERRPRQERHHRTSHCRVSPTQR